MVGRIVVLGLLFGVLCSPLSAATFTVTSTADSGAGSFNQAIIDANATPGLDNIHFNIGGGGPQIITTGAIPIITDAVVIDGTTQLGYSGTPIVTLDGNDVIGAELRIQSSSPSTIRGLVIIDMLGAGVRVETGGATITGNYIGVNASGLVPDGNSHGIEVFQNVDGVVITNNVISANRGNGIQLSGTTDVAASDNNIVQGNIIGLDATGTNDLGNFINGISVDGGSANQFGGTSPGEGNTISGNGSFGIRISARGAATTSATGNTVQGNRIGTNSAGSAAVPNTTTGVAIYGAQQTTIGGTVAGARNVISGNGSSGVEVGIDTSAGLLRAADTVIAGNLIGTDSTGTAALGNGLGVSLAAAIDTVIGGTSAGAGNVISGNVLDGVNTTSVFVGVPNPTRGTVIAANLIGTDITGTSAIANGRNGITIQGTQASTIGGPSASSRNVISGNAANGIALLEVALPAPTTGNVVQGNRIGTDATGTAAVPNGGAGVLFGATTNPLDATGNTIGGTGTGEGNAILFNGGDAIAVLGGAGNRFLGNSIDSNGALGIDLADDGVTANDAADVDTGPNNRQNYPLLTAVTVTTSTEVTATLNSTPARTFRIEFFNSPAADPSGFGEGRTFLGFSTVTTDAAGNASLAATLPSVAAGTVVTATATDQTTQDTSEFSNTVAAVFVPPTLNIGDTTVIESNAGTTNAVFSVTLSFPAPTDVTFQFATADGTAVAPGDYAATSGAGVIAAGATSTTITVPVVGDTRAEPDETFAVNITNITGAAAGDEQGQATITNDDVTPIPTFSEWMLVFLAGLLAVAGAITARR